ncbi:flagellar hook assembly protein FlgD [Dongia sp.]|uniref:flagellar hook assembly protein FlgD n=1 Tax=Dongia sp. TaxID=1977262 RepID=UPI0035B30786
MDIPSISDTLAEYTANAQANATSTGNSALGDLADTYDNFLTLLTKQLQNQDPLSPMDTAQFTQQLVAFSSVEQQIQSNKRLEQLINLQSSTNAYAAVSFIGTDVAIDSDKIMLQDSKAKFSYELDKTASRATLQIYDKNNQVVMIMEADRTVGEHAALWDGTDYFGNKLADGEYRVAVSYEDSQGKKYSAPITSYGTVDSAEIVDGAVYLNIGSIRAPLDKIRQITKATADA